jgi:hypothetical protein
VKFIQNISDDIQRPLDAVAESIAAGKTETFD